jgi:hypothetical protein
MHLWQRQVLRRRRYCAASRCSSSRTFPNNISVPNLIVKTSRKVRGILTLEMEAVLSRNVGELQRDAARQPRTAKTSTAPRRKQNDLRQSVLCVTWEMII